MGKLNRIEKDHHISLPDIYRSFYDFCSHSMPENLIGTDLLNNADFDLKEAAIKLLEEGGTNNFLESNDFVFMMHQGYIFWYFKANGDPDPIVFSYHENDQNPDNLGRFSDFIKEYIQ